MCEACEYIEKKKEAFVIYEDEKAFVMLSDKPLSKGHIIVLSREHVETYEELDTETVTHLFFVASYASTALYELYGGGQDVGTNILVNEGAGSNRRFDHFAIDVIPRKADDGIPFRWEPKQGDPAEIDEVLGKIKDEAFFVGKERAPEKTVIEGPETEKIEKGSGKNYLTEQLNRIP